MTSHYFILFYFFKIYLFIYLFVVNFVIHWNETAMGLHVFPIPIPPPTSLSTRSTSHYFKLNLIYYKFG